MYTGFSEYPESALHSRRSRRVSVLLRMCVFGLLLGGSAAPPALVIDVPSSIPTIQQAINAANAGDTVVVAPGTYAENINFLGKAITVRSQAGPEVTIIDGAQLDSVVTFSSGETLDSKIDGFTITHGRNGYEGGGIRIADSSPTVTNNHILDNAASNGQGIAVSNGSPLIQANLISLNRTCPKCGGGSGGGIRIIGGSSAQILDNIIAGNIIHGSSTGGGGVSVTGAMPTIRNNVIGGNELRFAGITGDQLSGQGGGIEILGPSAAIVVQNVIFANRAGSGRGVYLGGGVDSGSLLLNNTIVENQATAVPPGALIATDAMNNKVSLVNNIIVAVPGQLAVYCGSSPLFLESNNLFSPDGNVLGGSCGAQIGVNGNVSADPRFENATQARFHLLSESPAIDAGSSTQSLLPATDMLGSPRIVDGNGDGSAIVDMGAFEYSVQGPPVVQFSATSYVVEESRLAIQVTVMRGNDTRGEVSVDFDTRNVTATAALDYLASSGTLVFRDGESLASFSVPMVDDAELEGDETVLLSLRNPTGGAVLGNIRFATLTIKDPSLTHEYFPTNPGNKWRYLANGSRRYAMTVLYESVTVNRAKTRTFRSSIRGTKAYYSSDAQGIRLHRQFVPQVPIQGYGARDVILTYQPPVILATENAAPGQVFDSQGVIRGVVSGLGSATLSYSASYTFQDFAKVTVPLGPYRVIKLQGAISVEGQTGVTETLYLAKDVGVVKVESGAATSELLDTNTWKHDLAITTITAPKKLAWFGQTPSITKPVKVYVQNRSPQLETIADLDMLARLVRLDVQSLGNCPAPVMALRTDKIQKRMPISLKPKQQVVVEFAASFSCVNDPASSSKANPGHEDYRYTAQVDHGALDGFVDVHEADDSCPRSIRPPFVIDAYPDRTIRDRGCGAKKADGAFGGDVLTDLLSR